MATPTGQCMRCGGHIYGIKYQVCRKCRGKVLKGK